MVLACFLISGAAGLVYQTLWVRMIDKVVGSAPFAVAAVVSAFMGGLALGSWAAGRWIDRWSGRKKLLALYGAIEVGIGLYALGFETLAAACEPFYVLAYAHLWPYPWAYALFTFAGCFLLLLVPTTLMGATLPVLCRYYVTRLDALGTRAGALYSLNTIGAAAGVLPHLRKSAALAPNRAEAHKNVGMTEARAGNPAAAAQHLSAALRLRPDNAAARQNLQAALASSGQDRPVNTRTIDN